MATEYISRVAAIDTAFDYRVDVIENDYDLGYQNAVKDIAKGLNAIPAADVVCAPKWVSVKERLPDSFRGVLAYGPLLGIELARYNKNYDRFYCNSHDITEYVTHWMELPEEPEEEDDED